MKSKELQRAIGRETRVEGPKDFSVPLDELIKDPVKLGALIVWWNRWRAEHAKDMGIIRGHPPEVEEVIKWTEKIVQNGKMKEEDVFLLNPDDQEPYLVAEMFFDDYQKNHRLATEKKEKQQEAAV